MRIIVRRALLPACAIAVMAALSAPASAASSQAAGLQNEIQGLTQRVDDLQKQHARLEKKILQVEPTVGGRDGPPGARPKDDDLHDWSGYYAGASFGGGLANGIVEDKDCNNCANDSFSEGFRQGGVHAGYNKQFHHALIGLEFELNRGSQDHSGVSGGAFGGNAEATRSRIDWTGALLARAGVAAGDTLLFLEGGPAFAQLHASAIPVAANYSYHIDRSAPAFKAAAGVEFMISSRISVRAQYSVLELVDETAPQDPYVCSAGGTCRTGFTNMQQAATLGADWHF